MTGQLIYNFIASLFTIPRSITGDGVRVTLNKIKKDHLPDLQVYEIPTGTVIEDWVVPKEWNIFGAYIKNDKGEKLVSLENTNLHVVGYSDPVDMRVSFEELDEHLYSLPDQPSAIPYVTSYYSDTWGFCLSEIQRKSFKDSMYHVHIDAKKSVGSLTYADLVIEGKEEKEIFFSTYTCHPQMANNELSGPGVATYLAKWLSGRSNRYTYRFCFTPETVGSIAYISKNMDKLKNVYAAFNLTCVGDDRAFSYMPSRKGNTITDKVARHVMSNQTETYKEYSFMDDRGSDERQYCSPGVDLPMVSIMKSKYGEYPEYHTSLDNMEFISPRGLEHSFTVHVECIEILENNFNYRSSILGEPFLSKRGKNYMIVGGKENTDSRAAQLILNIMSQCDGNMDIVDLAESLGMYALDLIPILKTLSQDNLIEPI
jgi:aminopeptidase-like protein